MLSYNLSERQILISFDVYLKPIDYYFTEHERGDGIFDQIKVSLNQGMRERYPFT